KLNTAFHFGADAVYLGGSEFGLRAYADNFDDEGLKNAINYAHSLNKKVYVTANIFASNSDFPPLAEYLKMIEQLGADGVIISDVGVIALCKRVAPKLSIHLSTQANTTNGYAVKFWAEQGVNRVVLARELSLADIIDIRDIVGDSVELEVFVHGAMCISYSGRCLLSSYLSNRNSNRGECVQACRWEYAIAEQGRLNNPLTMSEDGHGTYILNSKDLNMLGYIDKLIEAKIDCFKIEGRMKSEYYVGSVINAYRRAIDGYYASNGKYHLSNELVEELNKTSHRGYTSGLYFENQNNVCLDTSKPTCEYVFVAEVVGYDSERGAVIVEQRNRFKEGDTLQILSNDDNFNKLLDVNEVYNENGERVPDCKFVQQRLYIKTDIRLNKYDILRRSMEVNYEV
ncbi:MAG: U32 family peptidase, partial [Clostridia bacterium]